MLFIFLHGIVAAKMKHTKQMFEYIQTNICAKTNRFRYNRCFILLVIISDSLFSLQ